MPDIRNSPFHLDTGDWLKDPKLSMCAPAARGIWIDLLCALHESGRRGQITGTPDQLARLCRCSTAEFVEAIAEFKRTNAADISERNGSVTVINRRMQREEKARLATRQRVASHRSNADVTQLKRECNNQGEDARQCININNNTNTKSEGLNPKLKEKKQEKKEKPPSIASPQVRAVFAYWQAVMRHPEAILLAKREQLIQARLREGYSLEDLKAAIDGCKASPHHMGQNDRHTVYDTLELILRDGGNVERFKSYKAGQSIPPDSTAPRKSACPLNRCDGSTFIFFKDGQPINPPIPCECQGDA
jgi:hypothetical protein